MMLFSLAAWAGVMYVVGGVALALSVVAVVALPWSPLVLAGFGTLGLVTLGVHLLRAAADQ
jgi:hypothetical protein